jgi:PadR family transcriptional regulator PadR
MHCMVASESQRTQMLKGILDPCLLAVVEGGEAYGYEIVTRLETAGLGEVAQGSVYPALTRLERAGLLRSERRPSESGPDRKYYRLSGLGKEYLDGWRDEWASLAASVDSVLGTRATAPGAKETA